MTSIYQKHNLILGIHAANLTAWWAQFLSICGGFLWRKSQARPDRQTVLCMNHYIINKSIIYEEGTLSELDFPHLISVSSSRWEWRMRARILHMKNQRTKIQTTKVMPRNPALRRLIIKLKVIQDNLFLASDYSFLHRAWCHGDKKNNIA